MVNRMRKPENQRKVEVQLTKQGKETYGQLYDGSMQTISALLLQIPKEQRETVVAAMETFLSVIDPQNTNFQDLLQNCCADQTLQGIQIRD